MSNDTVSGSVLIKRKVTSSFYMKWASLIENKMFT